MKHTEQAFIVGWVHELVGCPNRHRFVTFQKLSVNQMSGRGSPMCLMNDLRAHEMDSLQYNTEFGNGLPFTYTTQYAHGLCGDALWSGWRSLVEWDGRCLVDHKAGLNLPNGAHRAAGLSLREALLNLPIILMYRRRWETGARLTISRASI